MTLRLTRLLPSCLALAASTACGTPATPSNAVLTVDSGRVAVPGSSLFYERAGAGPVVVLLHANYVDRRMWDPQFLELARHFDVIRYDARGLGRSGPVRSPYSPASDLYQLLSSLGVHQAALVGASMGGGTSLDFAVAHPEMVSRIVLAGTGISGYTWPPTDMQERWRVHARAALSVGDTTGVAIAWLESEYLTVARQDTALSRLVSRLLADNVGLWKGLIQDQRDWDSTPAPGALASLHSLVTPLLVIVGALDAPDILRIADTLVTNAPHARRVIIGGTDHFPNLERPAQFLELLLGFLQGP